MNADELRQMRPRSRTAVAAFVSPGGDTLLTYPNVANVTA